MKLGINQYRLLVIALLFSFEAIAQPPIPNGIYSSPLYRYGQYLGVDSGLLMRYRRDTGFKPTVPMAMVGLDGLPYWWDGTKWWAMSGIGGTITPPPPVIVSGSNLIFTTVGQMMVYSGNALDCIVTDSIRGGHFFLKSIGANIVDTGMNFPSTVVGKVWSRDITASHEIQLSWYGVRGDGVTNDYYRMKAFADYIDADSAKGTINSVYFGNSKTYYVDMMWYSGDVGKDFTFKHLKGVVFYGGGCSVVTNGNFQKIDRYTRNIKFLWDSCRSITIQDLTVDRQNYGIKLPLDTTKPFWNAESSGYGFTFGGCWGVMLKNCISLNADADGFSWTESGTTWPRTENHNATMISCKAYNSGRCGMGVIQVVGLMVINCEFRFGATNIKDGTHYIAHAPSCGIDIEPDRSTYDIDGRVSVREETGNIVFDNCRFSGNFGSNFSSGGDGQRYHDVTVENSYFSDTDSANGILYTSAGGAAHSLSMNGKGFKFLNNICYFKYGCLTTGLGLDASQVTNSVVLVQGNHFYFSDSGALGNLWYRSINGYKELSFINNWFIGDSLATPTPVPGIAVIDIPSNTLWDGNYVFMPKEKFFHGNAGAFSACPAVQIGSGCIIRNSTFATDLTPTYLGSTNAHYLVYFFGNSTVENINFVGTQPGYNETIRPANGGNYGSAYFNSNNSVYLNHSLMTDTLLFSNGITAKANKIKYGAVIPTTGDYLVGDIIFNQAVTAGSNTGWICIGASTNSNGGTWRTFGIPPSTGLLRRLSTIERNRLVAQEGDEVYDIDYHAKMVYDGKKWTGFRYKGLRFQGYNGTKWSNLETYK